MPLTITKLKMWKDPGYTRECVEVPPAGSWKMPAADYVSSENLRPRKGSTLTAVELPLPYLQVMDMSYLYIEVEDGMTPTPNTVKLFGWIVSIEEIASSNEAVRITWTVDYWRTYAGTAVFGAGKITRCTDATYKRPYLTMPRRWKATAMENVTFMENSNDIYIVVVYNYVKVSGSNESKTYICIGTWKVGSTITIGGTSYNTISLDQVYNGLLDELMKTTPDSIIAIYATTVEPFNLATSTPTNSAKDGTTSSYAWYVKNPAVTRFGGSYSQTYESNDNKKAVIVDPYGTIMYEVPWGYSVKDYGGFTDIGTSAANLTMYFASPQGEISLPGATGLLATLPLIPLPFNSNAYSDYAYTYQREYDKRIREIQRNQQTTDAGVSVGGSLIGGVTSYAIGGNQLGAGMIGDAVSRIFTTSIGHFTQGYFNDELNAEDAKLHANQSSSLISPAGGNGWQLLVGQWKIVQLEADDVSQAEYDAHIANDGYTTDLCVADASAFVTAGGALQIQNLVLTGSIPPEGKTYIKNILSNGVRIVENNPTGVNP